MSREINKTKGKVEEGREQGERGGEKWSEGNNSDKIQDGPKYLACIY